MQLRIHQEPLFEANWGFFEIENKKLMCCLTLDYNLNFKGSYELSKKVQYILPAQVAANLAVSYQSQKKLCCLPGMHNRPGFQIFKEITGCRAPLSNYKI